jgi:hopene-associated glycosyltransferase HpnB
VIAHVVGSISLAIWVYLVGARGGFWRVREPQAFSLSGVPHRRIAVIIPARDEAEVIRQAIQSLLHQTYPGPFRIFLVDDESSDGTADVARTAAQENGKLEWLTVIRSAPRPAGWTGKLWAISEGMREARTYAADFYLLTDADVVHHPDSVSQLLARAESGAFDLVSLMVELHSQSFAERALIPAFVFFFFMLYPPRWVESNGHRTAAAAGGCILIRHNILEAVGGIARIRSEVIDDCALARVVKGGGGRLWLGITRETTSIRKYLGWKEVGQMISRSAFTQLDYSTTLLAVTCLGMLLTFLAPPILSWFGELTSALGLISWCLMTIAFVPTLRWYRQSPLLAPLLPLIAIFYLGATILSALQYWTGRGGAWKGRVQAPRRRSSR